MAKGKRHPYRPGASRCLQLGLLLLALATLGRGSMATAAGKPVGPRRLRHRIENILAKRGATRGFWGIEVARLRDGKILYARAADQLFLPASNMKLFTTAAALEKLGPEFRFRTRVSLPFPQAPAGAALRNHVPELTLLAGGDPTMGSDSVPYRKGAPAVSLQAISALFDDLALQVAAHGISVVDGDLVVANNYFLAEPYSGDWSVDDLKWGYGAPVTAMAIHDNELTPHVRAAAVAGRPATVTLAPFPDYYAVDNRVQTVAAGPPKQVFFDRAPGSMTLQVWGQVPLGTDEDEDPISIANPPRLAGELLKKSLARHGVAVKGHVRVLDETPAEEFGQPSAASGVTARSGAVPTLAEHYSPPLDEDIKATLKVSENLHAEMLLRTLGHELKRAGSVRGGLEVLRDFVAEAGITPEEAHFADGSGLSRMTLVEPEALVKLLEYMSRSKNFATYLDALPLAGVDGTLKRRFLDSPGKGRIHAKTGSLTHVHTLSGYMDLPSGGRLAFSIMTDNQPLPEVESITVIDRIASAIYEEFKQK